jgi:large subunit ribosomal protein L25
MSEDTIIVKLRDQVGKGAARAARREGLIPGVVYGAKLAPQPITVSRKQMDGLLQNPGLFNTLFELQTGDKKQQVLPRDVQLDVVTDVPLHVDFLRLSDTTEITINVPVVFVNEDQSEGLRQGAVLNIVRHQIEVRCLAGAIPASIEVDLAGAAIGDSIHIGAIPLPKGVVPTISDRDFTIVTLAAPTVQAIGQGVGEGEEGVEGAEGEASTEETAEGTEES